MGIRDSLVKYYKTLNRYAIEVRKVNILVTYYKTLLKHYIDTAYSGSQDSKHSW